MANYQQRFNTVLTYIESHLDQELSVEHLSQVANLSKYHFHRQFSALFGLGISAYIKQLRLKRATHQLAYRLNTKIIDIALMNGYESSEAFSRAFKLSVGQSPSEFRKAPDWNSWHEQQPSLTTLRKFKMEQQEKYFDVDIISFNEIKIAVLEHRGALQALSNSIRNFIAWRRENKLPPNISRTFNLAYNDPEFTPAKDIRFDLCAAIKSDVEANDYGIITKSIPAGRCARVRHIGSDDKLGFIANYLYSTWLDNHNEELRDFPLFFERVKFFPDVPENEAITDIYLPLK